MKETIDGIVYDTEKSQYLCDISNDLNKIDSKFVQAAVYKNLSGFFIAGEGGPDSIFAKKVGDSFIQGSRIILVSRDKAFDLIEKYGPIKRKLGDLT